MHFQRLSALSLPLVPSHFAAWPSLGLLFLSLACGSELEGGGPLDGGTATGGLGAVGGTGTDAGASGGDGSGAAASGGAGNGGTSPEAICLDDYLIEDFENSATNSLFRLFDDGSFGTKSPTGSFASELSSDGNGSAMHFTGSGYVTWGAGIGREFDPPSDCKGRALGIRFRAKGSGTLTFAMPVAAVVPTAEGGTCSAGAECNDSHQVAVPLTAQWETHEVLFSSLTQSPDWGLTASFDAENVLELLFTARPESMPFDFWIDDIELVDDGSPVVDPGSGGSSSTGGSNSGGCPLDSYLGRSQFDAWFPSKNAFYTYDNFCKALEKFPGFATAASADTNKREIAAFLANVERETGGLIYIEEIVPTSPPYYGRGPIQLTHSYNYEAAGSFLGVDLLNNPGLIASDGVITWETALWFWMHSDGAGKGTCHAAITGGGGFGQTINVINGGPECGGPNEAANQRIAHYQEYCGDLGVAPGSNITCW